MTELEALRTLAASPRVYAALAAIIYAWTVRGSAAGTVRAAWRGVVGLARGGARAGAWREHRWTLALLAAAAVATVAQRGCEWPNIAWPSLPSRPLIPAPAPAPPAATAVTYVYEKDQGGVPPAVGAALSELNTPQRRATTFEANTTDREGQTPEQYYAALAAAQAAGLPALVVTAGDKVLAVVRAPATRAQVLEAVR